MDKGLGHASTGHEASVKDLDMEVRIRKQNSEPPEGGHKGGVNVDYHQVGLGQSDCEISVSESM
jgi:hypothetical protein